MGTSKLARELAEQTGANIRDALKFVDDVGQEQAGRLLNSAEEGISWKLPATAGIGTAGALAWRQQDVEQAQARAKRAASQQQSIKDLIEDSGLSAKEKRQLLGNLLEESASGSARDDPEGSTGNEGIPGAFEDAIRGIGEFFGGDGVEQTVVKIVVLVIIISIVTQYATESALPTPEVEVR